MVYRRLKDTIEVLLVHPGGPFFVKKDAGAWSIPKGEYGENEDAFLVARREFEEETGNRIADGRFRQLRTVVIKSGKEITVWAVEADFEQPFVRSNEFELEWPPHSGQKRRFPEVDKAGWFTIDKAREKINPGQVPLIQELGKLLTEDNDALIHRK